MTSLYHQSIPLLIKYLGNFSAILKKAADYCETKGVKPESLLTFRLIEDMLPLAYQVQTACDTAKFLAHRIGDHENVIFPDDETTFDQLQLRITKVTELLKSVDPQAVNAKIDQPIIMETRRMGSFRFETGQKYVSEYAMVNFHFHVTTAYCILRHLGVNIGAMDYMSGVFQRP